MTHDSKSDNGSGASSDQYTQDIRADRQAIRKALRADVGGAHVGLLVTVIALVVIASVAGPRWTLIVSGCFTAWFALALAVIRLRGGRGGDALQRAYVATFGWGDYVSP
ncbi:hypothetical protein [Streptomyces sp. NBC_01618]|uniref:hypothetical protein n=1 Tax=Streptomyces sp. NBC_01618 TaxID=2975900 RepID=UPI0038636989|nr:hypothetical protein OH735_04665 [Streptomyces sp. NBC_01618]